jgi:UDPglucose 6-dehydrogenase
MSWLADKINLSHNFFEDIMKAREEQTEFLVDIITQHNGPYYILGKTFKEETNLILGSPAILLGNILKEKNIEFTHYDPFVDNVIPEFKIGTYFIATRHSEFKTFKFPDGSVVIDVWRYLDLNNNKIKYIRVGN